MGVHTQEIECSWLDAKTERGGGKKKKKKKERERGVLGLNFYSWN